MLKLYTLLLPFFFILSTNLNSQVDIETSIIEDNYSYDRDQLNCIKYIFYPKDTLFYRLEGKDSIIIDFGEPLLKNRNELYRITCDSVKNGRYFLTQELMEFISYESQGGSEEIERMASDWEHKKAWIEIDSLGRRYSFGYGENSMQSVTPGGPFQPQLFLELSQSCKKYKETWISQASTHLNENSNPPSLMNQSYLFRSQGLVDTLGRTSIRTSFVRTGNGFFGMLRGDDSIVVKVAINSFGNFDLDTINLVPNHMFASIEQKLQYQNSNEDEDIRGKQFTNVFYTLEKIIREPKATIDKKKKRKK